MAGEWTQVPFSKLCDITRGASPRPIHDWFVDVGIPWVKISDANSAQSRYITETGQCIKPEGRMKSVEVRPGDLILSNSATPGIPKFMGIDACIHDGWLLLRNLRNLDKQFAYYLLLHERPKLVAQGNGSVFTNLKTEILKNHLVQLPPISEQRAIAHILGTLDDKIELNRRRNQTLEAMARALFKDWFVDFGPVRAKMEGRARQDGARSGQPRKPLNVASDLPWPGAEAGAGVAGDPGLPKPLADLFPARLVDSELGEIPEGWEVAPLTTVVEVNPTRPLKKGVVAPYLDMANMPTHGHAADDVIDREFGSGMRFINGDTLVARITPCLENGKTAFVDFLADGQVGWGSTEYIVLRPKSPLPEEYAYCLARSPEFREFAIQSMTGTSGRQRVPAESLAHLLVAVPPKPIAAAFGRAVKPTFTRASAAVRESRTLAALRDALLPKLISGELCIEDAERFIGRAGA